MAPWFRSPPDGLRRRRGCGSGTASCIPRMASLCPRHCILYAQHCISAALALHRCIDLAAASVTGMLQGSRAGTHIVLSPWSVVQQELNRLSCSQGAFPHHYSITSMWVRSRGVPAAVLALVSFLQGSLHVYFSHVKLIRTDEWGWAPNSGLLGLLFPLGRLQEVKGFGGSSREMGSELLSPCWGKARRTGANWVLPGTVWETNSISDHSTLPLVIYCLFLRKGLFLFVYDFAAKSVDREIRNFTINLSS